MTVIRRFTRLIPTGTCIALSALSIAVNFSGGSANAATASSAPTAHDQVIVSGFSEKGDFINNGLSSVYFSHWASVVATTTGISLTQAAPRAAVSYTFAPVAGQNLAVGTYDNLQRAASRSAGFAGIEVTGPGRPGGCTRLTGSFRIWDLAASAGGDITRLDLSFVEHCGAGRPSNFGEVVINDAPHLGALITSATRFAFPDQTPTLPYVVVNPTANVQPLSVWQSATTVSHFTIAPSRASCASAVAAHSSCTYFARLVPPRPGVYTSTVLIVSAGSSVRLALSGPAGGV